MVSDRKTVEDGPAVIPEEKRTSSIVQPTGASPGSTRYLKVARMNREEL